MLYVNDTVRVRPFELSPNGDSSRIPSAEVHWKSDNESVLSVSGSGLLLGVGYGTATLTAERQSRSTSIQIWVAGTLHPDPVQTSTTWDLAGSPHVVDSNLPISGEEQLSTLTLEPGVLVLFRKGASLAVGWEGHGALVADGSSAAIRFEAEDSLATGGAWRGLEFWGAASSTLKGVSLRQCGGPLPTFPPDPGCIMFRGGGESGSPTVTLLDVEIRRAQSFGFVIEDGVEITPGSARMSVAEVDGYAGYYPASQLPRFPYGGTFGELTHPAIILQGGTISEDAEWADPGVAWFLTSDITVGGAAEPVLTLSPGLDLQVEYSRQISVGEAQPARLVAGSLDGSPVHIRAGGVSPGGAWGGILVGAHAGPSSLSNVRLEDCEGSCLGISGEDSASHPAVLVENVEISNAGGRGVTLVGGGRFADGSHDLAISGSRYYPLEANVRSAGTIPPGSYVGNGIDKIVVFGGELRHDAVWRDRGVPYFMIDGLGVEGSATLTLEQGVRLEFPPTSMLYVGQLSPGTLRAVGTAERPVVFTSSLDPPGPGAWMGVKLDALIGSETLLENVVVEWGGTSGTPNEGGSGGAIRIARDLGPMIRNVLVRGSTTCAILRDGPSTWTTDFTAPELGNAFEQNAGPDQCGP
jgi:hypothetical protein